MVLMRHKAFAMAFGSRMGVEMALWSDSLILIPTLTSETYDGKSRQ